MKPLDYRPLCLLALWWLSVVLALLALTGCKIPTDYTVRAVDVPYCPVDSAGWVAADSVPLGCGRPW